MMRLLNGQAGFVVRDGTVHPINKAFATLEGTNVDDLLASLPAVAKESR